MIDEYVPSQQILDRYAQVLVNFALNSGAGVKPGEVVQCLVPDVAKPLGLALQNTILKAGAHPVIRLLPSGFDKDFYTLANEEQLTFFPREYNRARADLFDHQIGIIADVDPFELKEVDPVKIVKARDARKELRDWLVEKETQGNFTWTLALWGVAAKAEIVGLSLEDYWKEIIKACFLDQEDPVAEWRKVQSLQKDIKNKLNALSIEYLTVKGADVDLKVTLGPDRIWKAGGGRNIPSFEFFTSPDWRGVEGWIQFNQPVYRYGNVIRNAFLRFEKGIIVEANAEEGQNLLREMLKSENANKAGEYSLTDKRMSRITHVMAETLFDENIGGPFGNSHLAFGMAYKDCYRGDASKLSKEDWAEKGFNESSEHTDVITTTDRTVTAHLTDGSSLVIYQDGMFVL